MPEVDNSIADLEKRVKNLEEQGFDKATFLEAMKQDLDFRQKVSKFVIDELDREVRNARDRWGR